MHTKNVQHIINKYYRVFREDVVDEIRVETQADHFRCDAIDAAVADHVTEGSGREEGAIRSQKTRSQGAKEETDRNSSVSNESLWRWKRL